MRGGQEFDRDTASSKGAPKSAFYGLSEDPKDIQQQILDALPAHVAILDAEGVIVAVNEAWRRFAAANDLEDADACVGSNYLQVCERSAQSGAAEAEETLSGIRRVLKGEIPRFELEYPCHSSKAFRWFRLSVTKIQDGEGLRAIVTHTDLTFHKKAMLESEGKVDALGQSVDELRLLYGLSRMLGQDQPDTAELLREVAATVQRSLRFPNLAGARVTHGPSKGSTPDFAETPWAFEKGYVSNDGVAGKIEVAYRQEPPEASAELFLDREHCLVETIAELLKAYFDRRSATESLQVIEANLAAARKVAHFGSWEITLPTAENPGKKLRWSDEMFRLVGFEPGSVQASGELFFDMVPLEDHAMIHAAFAHAVEHRTQYQVIHRLRRADGEMRVVRETGEFLFQKDSGRPVKMIGTAHDITEQCEAEEALNRSAAEQRELVRQLEKERARLLDAQRIGKVGSWENDLKRQKGIWSDEMHRIFDTDPETFEPTFEKVMQLIHPEDREKVEKVYEESMRSGFAFGLEHRVLARGGKIQHVEERWQVFFDEDGSPARVLGACRDITERKVAADRIAEQAALLDKAQDAILVRDLDDHVLYWNKSAERIYGWRAEEAMGRKTTDLFFKDPSPSLAAKTATLATGEWAGDLAKFTKDGRAITIECHWSLVRDEKGVPKSILMIDTDVTERRMIEQQYLRAQRMESIGTLAGGIAHDLNNVLAPILMSIDLLRLQERAPSRLSVLTTIEQSAKRGADLVRQVLSFARGMEGRMIEVEIGVLVEEIKKMAAETFPKNIEVSAELPRELWSVNGEPTQLHQILLNLAVNARDAMPQGGRLKLRAANLWLDDHYAGMHIDARPGPYVCIQVSDTGSGMSPEIIERIFDPFFTTKELGKGTGLGLSTTLAIVKSHRGFLRVHSEPGNGSLFDIYLPAVPDARQNAALQEATLPRGAGEVVLMVDDEDSVRQITSQTLEAYGYRVLVASEGAEAVALYVEHQKDIRVVLTDMMMPLMDGSATIQALKRMNPLLPVIATSGLSAKDMVAQATNAGVDHFIPKPYTAETLLTGLKMVLEGKPRPRAPRK